MAPAFPLGVEVPEPGGRLRDHPVCSVWRQSPRCRSRTRSCRAVSLFCRAAGRSLHKAANHPPGLLPATRTRTSNCGATPEAGCVPPAPPYPTAIQRPSPQGSNSSCSGYLDQRLGRLSLDTLPLSELQSSWRSAVPWIHAADQGKLSMPWTSGRWGRTPEAP